MPYKDWPEKITRREYFWLVAVSEGANVNLATEAVASTAIEHPEWDMDEVKSLDEWKEVNKH
jgi:hypothetical protein